MAKPIIHAKHSAKTWGGEPDEYVFIHEQMDEPKAHHATVKFRAIFHSSYGVWLVERLLGRSFTNSVGRTVSVRDVAEQHVLDDMGHIPSLDEYLNEMEVQPWMAGIKRQKYVLVD